MKMNLNPPVLAFNCRLAFAVIAVAVWVPLVQSAQPEHEQLKVLYNFQSPVARGGNLIVNVSGLQFQVIQRLNDRELLASPRPTRGGQVYHLVLHDARSLYERNLFEIESGELAMRREYQYTTTSNAVSVIPSYAEVRNGFIASTSKESAVAAEQNRANAIAYAEQEREKERARAEERRLADVSTKLFAIENEAARPSREAAFADVRAGKITKSEAMNRMRVVPPERAAIVSQYKEGRISYDDALNTLRGVPIKKQPVSAAPAKGNATPPPAVFSPPAKKG